MRSENYTYRTFVKDYLTDKSGFLIATVASILAVSGFLWLIDTRKIFIVFLVLLLYLPLVPVLLWDFYRRWRYYHTLTQRLENLDGKTLIHDVAGEADFAEGRLLQFILSEIDRYVNNEIADDKRNIKEYREYVETWVHEIKTPITLMTLLVDRLDNTPDPNTVCEEGGKVNEQITQALREIDSLVEQALFYARSTSVAKDFMVERMVLHDLISDVLKENATVLIGVKASISMGKLQEEIFADSKWMKFIISQIIANSVKYRRDTLALDFKSIMAKESVTLEIRDNGIGICEGDIERIFEKGFTGENGRNGSKSTGIGLYLCRKLCEKMNLKIRAISQKYGGTSILITFPAGSMVAEVE